jgi:hypothetical protein
LPEAPAVYSAAPIGVQDDAGHGAAARCHGHRQRPVGVAGVVMLASENPSTRREAASITEAIL